MNVQKLLVVLAKKQLPGIDAAHLQALQALDHDVAAASLTLITGGHLTIADVLEGVDAPEVRAPKAPKAQKARKTKKPKAKRKTNFVFAPQLNIPAQDDDDFLLDLDWGPPLARRARAPPPAPPLPARVHSPPFTVEQVHEASQDGKDANGNFPELMPELPTDANGVYIFDTATEERLVVFEVTKTSGYGAKRPFLVRYRHKAILTPAQVAALEARVSPGGTFERRRPYLREWSQVNGLVEACVEARSEDGALSHLRSSLISVDRPGVVEMISIGPVVVGGGDMRAAAHHIANVRVNGWLGGEDDLQPPEWLATQTARWSEDLVPGGCVFNRFVEQFAPRITSRLKGSLKVMPTVENLMALCNTRLPEDRHITLENPGCSLQDFRPVLDYYGVIGYGLTVEGNLLWKHTPVKAAPKRVRSINVGKLRKLFAANGDPLPDGVDVDLHDRYGDFYVLIHYGHAYAVRTKNATRVNNKRFNAAWLRTSVDIEADEKRLRAAVWGTSQENDPLEPEFLIPPPPKPSRFWQRPPPVDPKTTTFVHSVEELLEKVEQVGATRKPEDRREPQITAVVCLPGGVEEIIADLWHRRVEPGNVRCGPGGHIIGAFIRYKGGAAALTCPMEGANDAEQQGLEGTDGVRYLAFNTHMQKLRGALMSAAGISRTDSIVMRGQVQTAAGPDQSERSWKTFAEQVADRTPLAGAPTAPTPLTLGNMLRRHKRTAIGRHLIDAEVKPLYEIDVVRCYTSCIIELPGLPVFGQNDVFVAHTGGTIRTCAYYLIEVERPDGLLFSNRQELVAGLTVIFARSNGVPVTVTHELHPHLVLPNDAGAVIQAAYADPALEDFDRKCLGNVTSGYCLKAKNTKSVMSLSASAEEARFTMSSEHLIYAPVDKWMPTMGVQTSETDLVEGYTMVGRMIYDLARIKLFTLAAAVRRAGCKIYGANVDAVYTDRIPDIPLVQKGDATFEQIGLHSCTPCKGPKEFKPSARAPSAYTPYEAVQPSEQQVFKMVDERSDDERRAIVQPDTQTTPLLVLADYPGCGKSYAAMIDSPRETTLYVSAWNTLCQRQRAAGWRACTFTKLLGFERGSESSCVRESLEGVTDVVLDEIFVADLSMADRLVRWVHDNTAVFRIRATGDPKQLHPIQLWRELSHHIDPTAYYMSLLGRAFPRVLQLAVPKRVGDAERPHMIAICDALDGDRLVTTAERRQLFIDHGLKFATPDEVVFKTAEGELVPQLVAYNKTLDMVIAQAHAQLNGGDLWDIRVGEKLRSTVNKKAGEGRTACSVVYTVVAVSEAEIVMAEDYREGNVCTVEVKDLQKHTRRPYGMTVHAAQGASLGDRLVIWNAFQMTTRALRTAITRCGTMDITIVDDGCEADLNANDTMPARILAHIASDRARFPQTDAVLARGEYVTEEWFHEQLAFSEGCARCHEPLGYASIDRIDNEQPHTQRNCQLVCKRCQDGSWVQQTLPADDTDDQ